MSDNEQTKRTAAEIIAAYRKDCGEGDRPLSLRDFAGELSKITQPLGQSVSYQAISNWERGADMPNEGWLRVLLLLAPLGSWQSRLAIDLRECLYGPDVIDANQHFHMVAIGELPHPPDAQPVPVITIAPMQE